MTRDTFDRLRDEQVAENARKRAAKTMVYTCPLCINGFHDRCRGGHNANPSKTWVACACPVEVHGAHEPAGEVAPPALATMAGESAVAPPPLVITEPGLVFDMDDETYHADPVPGGSLSSTFARLLTNHVPVKAEALRRNRKPTKAMNLGKAAHAHALGAGPELIVWEFDGRTKEGKAERTAAADLLATEAAVAVTRDERGRVLGMAEVLRAELEIRDIIDGAQSEVSGFWTEGGVWCRARYDILGDHLAWDYKTAEDSSARGFEHAMETYGYHQQAEFYQRGLRALGHSAGAAPMRFIVQETQEPYLIQVHTCDDLAMEIAAALNDRAIGIFAKATATGEWDGYPGLHAEPTSLSNRYFFRYADLLPAHLNPFAEPEMSM